MEREVDRTFAVDLLEVLIEKYFITSPISTQNAILRHILFLSKYFLSSFQPFVLFYFFYLFFICFINFFIILIK